CKFVEVLKKLYPILVKEEMANKLDAEFLVNMNIKTTISAPAESSSLKPNEARLSGDFSSVSEAEMEEAIRNYLQIVREDTGVKSSKKKRRRASVKKSA
ncbi:hypothetical protein A2U01_0062802, partial [Trifolium medium]|nr:hypothetical protein [Trifolium medium]